MPGQLVISLCAYVLFTLFSATGVYADRKPGRIACGSRTLYQVHLELGSARISWPVEFHLA